MRMSSDLERMGDLARHVAKVARLRYPEKAVPDSLTSHILQMGQVAERIDRLIAPRSPGWRTSVMHPCGRTCNATR